ncbi:HEAT repeat domain-containing protein [bacterium]|nr:HEAT repeat domain-containing protein [bacterium]
MSVSRRLETELEHLKQLRKDPGSPELKLELERSLEKGAALLVASAATICLELQLTALEPRLLQSWERFRDKPASNDKGCRARTALARALVHFDCSCEELYLEGIHLRQPEAVWGGTEDTAAELRAVCAGGLAQTAYTDVAIELAELLADPEAEARLGAVRALAQLDAWRAEPLLRYKLLSGDEDPQVLGECCLVLLRLSPQGALQFVSRFLAVDDRRIAEASALALGESHLENAFRPLHQAWEQVLDEEFRRTLLLAMAMLRTEPALEFLLEIAATETLPVAEQAVSALALCRHDDRLYLALQDIGAARDDDLATIVEREFLRDK